MFIGYARVSTLDQDPEMQVGALRRAGCDKIFVERASGAKRDRPELMAAIEYARPDDTIVVWKLDRLARSLKQLIETVEGLEERGVGFKSLTETIDTTTPGGRLVFTIFAGLAEFERSIIRERTVAGLEAARSRGRVGGRPRTVSDDYIAAAKALLKAPGITVKKVAERIGCSEATLYRYLPAARANA
jgi:DNA invertase Pin-like site-specific DNA recombinase